MINQICPICNGLVTLHEICSSCGKQMDEIGRMEDYKGPYSPYMDKDSFTIDNGALVIGDPYCVHLYHCDVCDRIEYRTIKPISI